MPSRMIHYVIAHEIAKEIEIKDFNRFAIGSLCPDMSTREDGSKLTTHYMETLSDKKGGNWNTFLEKYGEAAKNDELYLGILCHLITDMIWFHDIMESYIRSKAESREQRHEMYMKGYDDFHRLNYILKEEYGIPYQLTEDRNIEFEGIHPELYDDVIGGLYDDFYKDPKATKEELEIYKYDVTSPCIQLCIEECIGAIKAFRKGEPLVEPEKYYVPLR